METLGNVASYINGYAFKPADWSEHGTPIIRIQDLTGNSYQMNHFNGEIDSRYEVKNGDILISWSASLGIYVWKGEDAVLNQHIFKVILDEKRVIKSFFIHQVENILEKASSQAHGATMKHLTRPIFNSLPFYLPSLSEQQKIADVLDGVSSLIDKRKRQLAMLDELVKSRFVEMFGDPKYNNLKWSVYCLGDLFTVGSSKRIYQSEQVPKGIPFLRISDLMNRIDKRTETAELFITEELYEKLKKERLVPMVGDILLTSRGTLGKCYEIRDCDKFYFQDGMISWLYDRSEKLCNVYFMYLFQMPGFRIQIDETPAGSTVNYLSISRIKNLKIMCPPLSLQQQFANFVSRVDGVKVSVTNSLQELETLKRSLLQEYFS